MVRQHTYTHMCLLSTVSRAQGVVWCSSEAQVQAMEQMGLSNARPKRGPASGPHQCVPLCVEAGRSHLLDALEHGICDSQLFHIHQHSGNPLPLPFSIPASKAPANHNMLSVRIETPAGVAQCEMQRSPSQPGKHSLFRGTVVGRPRVSSAAPPGAALHLLTKGRNHGLELASGLHPILGPLWHLSGLPCPASGPFSLDQSASHG